MRQSPLADMDDKSRNYQLTILGAISFISLLTRFYDIHEPAHVCWDETHFGKMASWYMNGTFFFDVHPPLGKMLIALSGSLSGYDGQFPFDKPGDEYQHWTQYVGMRIFCATLGMFLPIFTYSATLSITNSQQSAILAAIFILFDNGLITLTRYILLDAPLLFFISSSLLGLAKFSFQLSHERSPKLQFTAIWWFWLIWTGVSISCAFSVKFVGLFTILLVGLRTIYDLWIILGDIDKRISYFCKHFVARTFGLILVPIALYISIFWIHLRQLNHSGNGDGFYSSAFQSQLIGNSLHNSSWPAHLAYGAEISIKNNRIGGAYLHSHWHLYPEGIGARQQQVTTYSHKDSNNKWIIKRAFDDETKQTRDDGDIYVRDGDMIRLEHVNTRRNLHSHFELAPITKRHYQVTCYGQDGLGDANDIWILKKEKRVKIIEIGDKENEDDRVYTVKTRFMLIHYITNCALHSHSRQLPKWAYDQLEVTCNPKLHDKNNFWNIEDNYYPKLENVSFEDYAPSFMDRFVESHAVMLQGNAGLKPKEGEVTSRPWQWPLNYKGQFFSASKGQKVYLLGNPIIWWLNILNIPNSALLIAVLIVSTKLNTKPTNHQTKSTTSSTKRKKKALINHHKQISKRLSVDEMISYNDYDDPQIGIECSYIQGSTWILLGWLIHYVPFYFMGRVLYFHHYFPAFLFSSMLTAMNLDFLITILLGKCRLSSNSLARRRMEFVVLLGSIVIYTYTKFIPITYGTRATINDQNQVDADESTKKNLSDWRDEQKLSSLKWLDSWEF